MVELTFLTEIRRHKIRFLKSCAFYASFLLVGSGFGMVGPTLIDLAIQTNTDLTRTSFILPLRSAGYVIGTFVCTLITERVNVHLTSAATTAVSGLVLLLVPFMYNIWALLFLFLLLGIAFGVQEAYVNIYMIHLWGREVTPFMQALHFFFGLGALLAPITARPFILPIELVNEQQSCHPGDVSSSNVTDTSTSQSFKNSTISADDFTASDLKLIYPYAIYAFYSVFLIIWFILMYIYAPHSDPHPTRLTNSSRILDTDAPIDLATIAPRSHSISYSGSIRKRHDSLASERFAQRNASRTTRTNQKQNSPEISMQVTGSRVRRENLNIDTSRAKVATKWYQVENTTKVVVIMLANLFMHVFYGLEITFGSFLAPFCVSSNVGLNTRDGAQLSSIFWAAFTFWRLVTVFYIGFTGPRVSIVINLIIIIFGTVIIVPWGYNETWALYAGTVLIGIGISPLWASMFGFLELYFPVSSGVASSMMSSAAVGEFVYPAILAKYMECQSIVFLYMISACSVSVVIVFSAILIICHYKMTPESVK